MDFYLDECLPPRIARSIDAFDDENRIFSIEDELGKGTDDVLLIDKLNKLKADVIITQDLKFKHRIYQYREYNKNNLSVFAVKIAQGAPDQEKWRVLINKWDLIRKLSKKLERPFICVILKQKDSRTGRPYHIEKEG